jgi:hypothetical protein
MERVPARGLYLIMPTLVQGVHTLLVEFSDDQVARPAWWLIRCPR